MEKEVVVVTGGSSGIGLAICELAQSTGNRVCCIDVTPYPKLNNNISYFEGDVSNFERMEEIFAEIAEKHGRISGVVANAGIYFAASLLDTCLSDLSRIIDVNIKGTFHTLQLATKFMAGQGGSIVAISSDQALVGKGISAAYGLTKAAILQLCKSTAIQYAKSQNIRVNCVCPGAVATPLCDRAVDEVHLKYASECSKDELWKKTYEKHPTGTIGSPQEIAEMVLFLLSRKADFINGATISIDGGYTAA